MKKILGSIALAALVASPFSTSAFAESFSASAHGYTNGIKTIQVVQTNTYHDAPVQADPAPSDSRAFPSDPVSCPDEELLLEMLAWFGDSILSRGPFIA